MNQEHNIERIWISFEKNKSMDLKNQLIMHYIWLVKYVIQKMNLPKNSILNDEDFLSFGILGLNHSIERFERERGIKFESYAVSRIKGTILDELRRLDWLSRSARKKAQDYLKASDDLQSEQGREVTSEEIRKKLNVNEQQYRSYIEAAAIAKASLSMNESSKMTYLEEDEEYNLMDEIPNQDDVSTLDKIVINERISYLTEFLKQLPEKKRLVVTLYYYEELTFKQIGKVLDVSESRVCQIHSQVIDNLRNKLKEFDNA
jgi:RNA polymerase sigma factor for flagellar operon FliA